ncbi:MAG: glycosyltransferase family 2 protein, partial [Lachnospiraceae bacterium]|nr:glycosyltransferase family 2 protein [Lachnospiraceae bacterium]
MILYVVVPCYNEEDVLPETAKRLRSKMNDLTGRGVMSEESRVLFVTDGSKDDTWNIIRKLHEENSLFQGLSLSRNRGHQNALLAGLMTAKDKCDACISMDADLQDDINAMDEMIEQYKDGCDVVYGIRKHRDADSFFKRSTAILFYRVMNWMGVQMVSNHA